MKNDAISGYAPSDNEEYMSERQVEYFRRKIVTHKRELREKVLKGLNSLRELKAGDSDILDRSNSQINIEMEFASSERYSRLIRQYDKALERMEDGSFGYCEITGLAIGLKRLEALPCATLSIKAQQLTEESQRPYLFAGNSGNRRWRHPI